MLYRTGPSRNSRCDGSDMEETLLHFINTMTTQ
jgi:hypothetical protein